jgi:hypothetical protein
MRMCVSCDRYVLQRLEIQPLSQPEYQMVLEYHLVWYSSTYSSTYTNVCRWCTYTCTYHGTIWYHNVWYSSTYHGTYRYVHVYRYHGTSHGNRVPIMYQMVLKWSKCTRVRTYYRGTCTYTCTKWYQWYLEVHIAIPVCTNW